MVNIFDFITNYVENKAFKGSSEHHNLQKKNECMRNQVSEMQWVVFLNP